MVAQLSDPAEYADTEDANRGSLDEKGMAFRSKIETYQRIRAVILRDAWLINNECEDDEEGNANGADSDEDTPNASAMVEQSCWSQEPSSQQPGPRRRQWQWRCRARLQAAHRNPLQALVVSDTVER
jgi:hypothetical protein